MNGRIRPGAQASGELSPTKPQGILLTPGTATFRRKTVSFGAGVVDNEGRDAIGRSGVPNDCPGKFPSPYTPKVDENLEPARRTALTKTLEAARGGQTKKSSSAKSAAPAPATSPLDLDFKFLPKSATSSNADVQNLDVVQSKNPKTNAINSVHSSTIEDFDGDMTLDLAEPHSHSGRYWKSEYDRYHEEAIAEMKRLVKYKQLVKSYAKKKDAEAIDSGEKLKEEQQKVANMEAKISELAAQIANSRLNGRENENQDLIKDLARQTALARGYGNKAGEFQAALSEGHARLDHQSNRRDQRHTSASTAQTPSETNLELNRASKQLAEMGSLQDEMHRVRLNLSMAEKKVSSLQDENVKLAKDLAKVSEELDKSKKRRQSAEAQSHERALLLETIQKDYDRLKELAKSQRRDAEGLLKKRHDQVVKLKKEIRSLKEQAAGSTPDTANQVTSRTHSEIGVYVKEEVSEAGKPGRFAHVEDLMSFETPPKSDRRSIGSHGKLDNDGPQQRARETVGAPQPQSSTGTRNDDYVRTKTGDRGNNHLLDSKILTLGRSTEKFESVQQKDTRKTDRNVPRHSNMTSKLTALSEIINNAKVDHSLVRNQSLPTSQLSESFQERFSSLSLNTPGPALPSPEPSFALAPSRRIQDRRGADSLQSSMFNIPSSPPKQVLPRPRSSVIDACERHNGNASSSRMSSMSSRARIALSSDRAAAAKARLEQKSAEKKRAQETLENKENIRD
jgi:hypothetical protein